MVAADTRRAERFRYQGFEIDPESGVLSCSYAVNDRLFTERITFEARGDAWNSPAAVAAARLVYLVAGVSYYKTAAPLVIDMGDTALTDHERAFLLDYYRHGLAEYAYRNEIDLDTIAVEATTRVPTAVGLPSATTGRPLVPFGGGIDSIVVADQTRRSFADTSLFVVSKAGDTFAAIEASAAVTGLPVLRAERDVDPQVLQSRALGFLNGHVPVTAIISAIAVAAAVLDGRDAVVMSNEWSASSATVEVDGRSINHQWSKSYDFERLFRALIEESIQGLSYFSAIRPYSELWVAERFAALPEYHFAFRSCNRAFHIDPAERLDTWCGTCDKCCFIDLILAPFIDAERLAKIFDGREPLANAALRDKFRSLLGDESLVKPFECVGDADECRVAVVMAAERADREGNDLLQQLAREVRASGVPTDPAALRLPLGPHFIEAGYASSDLMV